MREGWKEYRLGDVAQYINEKIDANLLNTANYISADNMLPDKGGITLSEYLPTSGKVTKYAQKDILVSNIRPYFKKIWYAKNDGGCSNDVIVFRAKSDLIDKTFLYYNLSRNEFFDFMMAGANGTKMPRGNKKAIPSFKIHLPPLPTQRKIAKILSAYDDLIENNLKRIKLLEEMAQKTYEEWFVRFKFPGHETAKFDKETGLPEGWRNVKIKDLVIFSQGLQVPIEDQSLVKKKNYKRFIRIVDITQGGQEERFVCSNNKRYEVKEDDLFMIRYGSPMPVIGHSGIIANNFFKIQIKNEQQINTKYLFYFLSQKYIKDYLLAISVSSTMPAISFKTFGHLKIILPKISIQSDFAEKINNFFKIIKGLKKQNQRLKEARDILLPRLMTGMLFRPFAA